MFLGDNDYEFVNSIGDALKSSEKRHGLLSIL
jgi:hypothetical protein